MGTAKPIKLYRNMRIRTIILLVLNLGNGGMGWLSISILDPSRKIPYVKRTSISWVTVKSTASPRASWIPLGRLSSTIPAKGVVPEHGPSTWLVDLLPKKWISAEKTSQPRDITWWCWSLFSFPFWSQLAMSRLHPAAVTGKEERHASEAHVAPTEARGAAGGCVDLWVCVQVIHTWACENNHGFSEKPMKSQKKTSRHHQKKCFWRCLLPHLELKRGSLKHLLPPLLVSIFPTLDVHHNLLSSRSFKGKMGEGMRRIPVDQSWWSPQVNTLRSGSHGRLWPGWLND